MADQSSLINSVVKALAQIAMITLSVIVLASIVAVFLLVMSLRNLAEKANLASVPAKVSPTCTEIPGCRCSFSYKLEDGKDTADHIDLLVRIRMRLAQSKQS